MSLPYSEESAKRHLIIGDDNESSFNRYMDTVGDGSGTVEMNTVIDIFYIKPEANEVYIIDSITITVGDNAILSPIGFGGGSALANGIKLDTRVNVGVAGETLSTDIRSSAPIKTNFDLFSFGRSDSCSSTAPGCIVSSTRNFKEISTPIRLDGVKNEALVCETQDVMTGVSYLRIYVSGRIYNNSI